MLRPFIGNRTFDWIGDAYGPYIDGDHFLGHSALAEPHEKPVHPAIVVRDPNTLHVPLPGLSREDISIVLTGNVLEISRREASPTSEAHYIVHEFETLKTPIKIGLPESVTAEQISAELHDGMLVLKVEIEPEQRAESIRQIEIS